MDLKELFALFQNMENLNEIVSSPLSQIGVVPKAQERGTEESYRTEFFTLMQNALGESLLSAQSNLGAAESFSALIDIINSLKSKNPGQIKNSQTIAVITFVEAIYDMIYILNPDNPDVAGKMFERFVAFATKGQVSSQLEISEPERAGKLGATNRSIFDLLTQTNEYVSVKLLSGWSVTGSISNLYKFLTNTKEVTQIGPDIPDAGKSITYIVTIKTDENTLTFYSFVINSKNFVKIIGESTIQKYNEGIGLDKKIAQINYKFNQLRSEREQIESRLDNDRTLTRDQFEELRFRREEILTMQLDLKNEEDKLPKTKKTSFSINKEAAAANKIDVLWDKQLSITIEQKEEIVKSNKLSFQTNIKSLIDEATAVYYKVNNLLLKMEDETADITQKTAFGQEAYDSASLLERNILSLTKEKQLGVVETPKSS